MDSITKHIQAITLDILLHFDAVCKENGLTYYLAYGSLLGGVRHQGFIPWDDDLDVWMPRAEYEKLLVLTNKDNSDYALISDYQSGDLSLAFQGKYGPA